MDRKAVLVVNGEVMMKILSIERKRSTFACKSTSISKDVNIKEAKEELDAVINQEKKKGMSIKEMIREGKPIKEILKVVKEENIDLIIMLAHSEWRLEHFLFGRIKEEIIRKTPCSILLIKEEPGKGAY